MDERQDEGRKQVIRKAGYGGNENKYFRNIWEPWGCDAASSLIPKSGIRASFVLAKISRPL